MKKTIFKVFLSIVLISLTVSFLLIYNNFIKPKNDVSGEIEIKLEDIESNLLSSNKYNFRSEDTLFDILKNNYEIRYETSTYGIVLLDINEIKTDFTKTFIAIYVDNKFSNYGISEIPLYDKEVILFKEQAVW